MARILLADENFPHFNSGTSYVFNISQFHTNQQHIPPRTISNKLWKPKDAFELISFPKTTPASDALFLID